MGILPHDAPKLQKKFVFAGSLVPGLQHSREAGSQSKVISKKFEFLLFALVKRNATLNPIYICFERKKIK